MFTPFDDIVFPEAGRYEYVDEPIGRQTKAHVYVWTSEQNKSFTD